MFEFDEPPGDVCVLAGPEARTEHDEQRPLVITAHADGMSRLVDADEHAVQMRAVLRTKGHGHVATRLGRADEVYRRFHRHVRSEYDLIGFHTSAIEANLPAPLALEARRAGVLMDAPAAGVQRVGQADQIACRVELGLIRKLQCAGGGEGQGRLVDDPCGEAQAARRFGFIVDGWAPVRRARIGVGGLTLVVAIDGVLGDPVTNTLHGFAVGVGVALRQFLAEGIDQVAIDQRMLGGDLCGGAPGDLSADLAGFEHHDGLAGFA